MTDDDFWDRVKRAAEKLGIPNTTVRTWKNRGRVSKQKAIAVYRVLAGTPYEVPIERLDTHSK